jgi:hypothetical protein
MKKRHATRSILLIILLTTLASTRSYAGWQPFKKPFGNNGLGITTRTPLGRSGVEKAVDEEANKSIDAVKAAPTKQAAVDVATKELRDAGDAVRDQADEKISERQRADALAAQKNGFLLAAASLVLTNTFTLGGLLIGWPKRKLEVRKLLIDIEERELAVKELKRKLAGDDPNMTI